MNVGYLVGGVWLVVQISVLLVTASADRGFQTIPHRSWH